MFDTSTLYRQTIKLFHQKLWWELIGPCMDCNSISIKPYIKSHLELQTEITLIELAPSPYFYMNMYARFDENPAIPLQDIKETKRYGRTDARTNACTDNVKTVYPPRKRGYKNNRTNAQRGARNLDFVINNVHTATSTRLVQLLLQVLGM